MATKTKTKKVKKPKTVSKKPAEKPVKVKLNKEKEVEEEVQIEKMPAETIEPKPAKTPITITEKYYEAIGRRKEATARVRLYTKKSTDQQVSENKALIVVNDKPYYEYFRTARLQNIVESPLKKLKSSNRFKATAKISGGGISGQADAVKFGLARALVLFDANFSKKLRKSGYLTRDAREKERRKYGLKKARKAPQWAKR